MSVCGANCVLEVILSLLIGEIVQRYADMDLQPFAGQFVSFLQQMLELGKDLHWS